MSDVRTVFRDFAGDWEVGGPSLGEDDGLETAVVLSLFTDRLAGDDDVLPSGSDRRGWWGDTFADVPGDRIGSRLWLLSREKVLPSVLVRAREYAKEALQWLVDDGVAREVNVVAEHVTVNAPPGTLGLQVEVVRSAEPVARFRFEVFWRGSNAV